MWYGRERKLPDKIEEAEDLALAGKLDEAVAKYNEAIAEDDKNPLAYVGKASVIKAQGKFGECAEELEKALSILPEWNVAKEDEKRFADFCSMLHVLKAEALLYADNPDAAFAELDKADAVRDADAASLVVRANAHAQKKEWEAAGNCLYRAEEWCFLHDDSMLTQVWLTKVHCAQEAGGIFAPAYAAEVYASGNWRMPKGTAEELLERAGNLRKEGLLYDALRYYDACLAAEPADKAHVLFLKGIVFEQLKRFDDAYSAYADALAANPSEAEEFSIRVRWANARALRGD